MSNTVLKRFVRTPVLFVAAFCSLGNALRAAEFIPLGFQTILLTDVSDDGTVVAGQYSELGAFRWTEATGVVGLGSQTFIQSSNGPNMSGDGSTIIGHFDDEVPGIESFIHTTADGTRSLGPLDARAISFDGSVIVGRIDDEAFRWTEESGAVGLGLLSPDNRYTIGRSVSADGMTVVGSSVGASGDDNASTTFRWTPDTGMVGLGVDMIQPMISDDGSVIVGQVYPSGCCDGQIVRWTEDAGVVPLGQLDFARSLHRGINRDGSVIVGGMWNLSEDPLALIWSERYSTELLQEALIDRHGLGSELEGWELRAAQDISADGRYLIGYGSGPNGPEEAWLVRLDRPFGAIATPEPSIVVLLSCAGVAALLASQRRRRCSPTMR